MVIETTSPCAWAFQIEPWCDCLQTYRSVPHHAFKPLPAQCSEIEVLNAVLDKAPEVCLAYPAYRIYICTGAVILGHIPSQAIINQVRNKKTVCCKYLPVCKPCSILYCISTIYLFTKQKSRKNGTVQVTPDPLFHVRIFITYRKHPTVWIEAKLTVLHNL